MHRALLALAVLLVLPASTEAAPPWSAPRDVSGPFTFVDGLWAAGGLIGWRSGDGEAGAPVGRSGDPVFFGTGGGAVAIVRPVGSNRDPRSELRVAFRSRRPVRPLAAGGQAPADRAADAGRQRARRSRGRLVRGPQRRQRPRLRRAAARRARVRQADPAGHRPHPQRIGRRRLSRRRAGGVEHGRQGPHAAQAPGPRVRPRRDAARRPRLGRQAARRRSRAPAAPTWRGPRRRLFEGGDSGAGLLRGRGAPGRRRRASAARSGSTRLPAPTASVGHSTSRSPAVATRSRRGSPTACAWRRPARTAASGRRAT